MNQAEIFANKRQAEEKWTRLAAGEVTVETDLSYGDYGYCHVYLLRSPRNAFHCNGCVLRERHLCDGGKGTAYRKVLYLSELLEYGETPTDAERQAGQVGAAAIRDAIRADLEKESKLKQEAKMPRIKFVEEHGEAKTIELKPFAKIDGGRVVFGVVCLGGAEVVLLGIHSDGSSILPYLSRSDTGLKLTEAGELDCR